MGSSEAALFSGLRTAGLTEEEGGLKIQSRPSFEQETQDSSPSSLKHLIFRRRHSLQALGDLPRFFGVGEGESGVDGRAFSCEIATGRFLRGVLGATFARGSLEFGRFDVARAVLAWLGSRLRTGLDSISCEKSLSVFFLPE